MSGKITRQKFITRAEIQANLNTKFYVFGDNMLRSGLGGQAKEMRGESNTIGIPTKWRPTTQATAYFSDADWNDVKVRTIIGEEFLLIEHMLNQGYDIVIPSDGIGTGRAKLSLTAPKIFNYIQNKIKELEEKYNV